MSCWKCGAATEPNVTECEWCEIGQPRAIPGAREKRLLAIDFDKIVTPEDVRLFFRLWGICGAIAEDHPQFDQLKRFLRTE